MGVGVPRFQSFDLLATLVAVVRTSGVVLFANAALEDALGISRRNIEGSQLPDCFTEPHILHNALEGAGSNEFAALRYDAWLKRVNHEPMPVHVVVAQTDTPGEAIVELLPLEQQARQEREERLMDQAQANKELIRNLAHEIKNPLGGIRGAAQLLQMEIGKDLTEYTQVIIHEADRLQTLVDRLLAPHRRPHLVGDVNIHEVCERVRSLILAEFPKGLKVVRDYDTSLPDFRGDREQLIQIGFIVCSPLLTSSLTSLPFALMGRWARNTHRSIHGAQPSRQRNQQLEVCTARDAVTLDQTVVLLNKSLRQCQPQPRTALTP